MLERVSAFEPGIEHAVRKQHVGCAGIVQSPPGSKAVKLPDSVHDDGIVAPTVLPQPGKKPRTEGIPKRGWAQSLDGQRAMLQKGRGRGIEGRDLNLMSLRIQCAAQLLDALNRAATGGVHGADDVLDFHCMLLKEKLDVWVTDWAGSSTPGTAFSRNTFS